MILSTLGITMFLLTTWLVTNKQTMLRLALAVGAVTIASTPALAGKSPASLFTYVDTLPQLQQKLRTAKSEHRPVMIEFFASWCPVCKGVDREILSDDTVQNSMRGFKAIRVDVSETNPDLMRLMQEYQVYSVPTMVFYDKNGNLFQADELSDGISKDSLLSTLKQLS